jgi:hypothetical protein
MAAGDIKVVRGTTVTLEANGAAITNNAIGQADDASYTTPSGGVDYPDVEFALMVNYTSAPTANSQINLVIRPKNIDGSNAAQVPTASYRPHQPGFFRVAAVTGAQYLYCRVRDVPQTFDAYLYNNNTGQSVPAGWTLKATPVSYAPS